MVKNNETDFNKQLIAGFEQYPWAALHDDAISWITRYMDTNIESAIRQLDSRILKKVADQH